jgi:hypothetical protein
MANKPTEQVLCITATAEFGGTKSRRGGGSLWRNFGRGLPRGAKEGLGELEFVSRS